MQMTILEALMIITSVLVLPAIAVLTISFFTGGLTKTEDVKYVVLGDPDEVDYWADEPTHGPPAGGDPDRRRGARRRRDVGRPAPATPAIQGGADR